MKASEIRSAKVGDRVKFEPLDHDAGEYCEGTITKKINDGIVEITWDDGVTAKMKPLNYTRVFLLGQDKPWWEETSFGGGKKK